MTSIMHKDDTRTFTGIAKQQDLKKWWLGLSRVGIVRVLIVSGGVTAQEAGRVTKIVLVE